MGNGKLIWIRSESQLELSGVSCCAGAAVAMEVAARRKPHNLLSYLSEEIIDVKRNCCYLFLISLLLLFCIPLAAADGSATVAVGFGSNHVKSTGLGIDYNSYSGNFETCTLDPSNPYCMATPALNGFFLGVGGDVLPWKHTGFGANISFQPSKADYGQLQYRQIFYDFNGIYAPVNGKRAVLKLLGGIGGAKTSFSYEQTSSVGSAITSSSSVSFGSSSHFQIHAGAGLEVYVTRNMFIRPQFDYRYIPNLTQQFGSKSVIGGMVWVGFRTGGR
jgi:opacity protein-like surface antigen